MLRKDTLIAVLGSPIAYYSIFARVLGGVEEGIFVSQFFYWYGKGHDPEGWTYKTQDDILQETGLTRRNQETARKRLRNLKVLEEKRAGVPAKLYYRLNLDILFDLLNQAIGPDEPLPPSPTPPPPSPSTSDLPGAAPSSESEPSRGQEISALSDSMPGVMSSKEDGEPLGLSNHGNSNAAVFDKEKARASETISNDDQGTNSRMAESAILECTDPTIQDGGIRQTEKAESAKQKRRNPPNRKGGIRQTVLYSTKTTTKTTTETTTNTTTDVDSNLEPTGAANDSVVVDVLIDPVQTWILDDFQELLGKERTINDADQTALAQLATFPEHLIKDAFDAARTWLDDPKRAPIHALGRWLVGTAKRKQEAEARQGSRAKRQAQTSFDFDWEEYQAALEERRPPVIVKPEDNIWEQVLYDLSLQFPRTTLDAWLVGTWLISTESETYQVGTPTTQARDWLQHRMASHIQKTLSRVVGQSVQVQFQVAQAPRH